MVVETPVPVASTDAYYHALGAPNIIMSDYGVRENLLVRPGSYPCSFVADSR